MALNTTGEALGPARRTQASIIAKFGALLLSDVDPEVMFTRACICAADGMNTARAKVMRYRPENDDLIVRAGVGWKPGVIEEVTLPATLRTPAGCAFLTKEPVAVEDFSTEDRFDYPDLLKEHGIVALLNVPIRIDGFLYGVLEVDARRPRSFGTDDVNFLLAIAHLLAASIRRQMQQVQIATVATQREKAEGELRQTNERLSLAQAAAHVGVWDWNLVTDQTTYTPECCRLYGWPADQQVRHGQWLASIHPDDREAAKLAIKAPLESGEPYEDEYRVIHPNGDVRWIAARGQVLLGPDGTPVRFIGINIDVTERKAREEHIELLMRETMHRSKNQLMIIQVLARQTATVSRSLDEFGRRFSERLHGLSALQDLLVRQNWEGIRLRDLIQTQLRPYIGDPSARAALTGPDLLIKPEPAQNLGLAFHELASNAARHGAFSVPGGEADIRWLIEAGEDGAPRFRLEWRERGGPPVSGPQWKGFGHIALERIAPGALDGSAKLEFTPEGVSWRLEGSTRYFVQPGAEAA